MNYKSWLREQVGNESILVVYVAAVVIDSNGRFPQNLSAIPITSLNLNESLPEACVRLLPQATIQRLLGVYSSPDFVLDANEQSVTAVFLCEQTMGLETRQQHVSTDWVMPSTLLYQAILADLEKENVAASFRAGAVGNGRLSPEPYYKPIRRQIGQQTLLMPAAAAFIRNDNGHILLQQRGDFGDWGALGGGMELGERLDQTVINEVREESGLEVEVIRLIGIYSSSQFRFAYPNGDQINIVSVYFECQVVGGTLQADGVESLDLRYFPPDALPPLESRHYNRIQHALSGKTAAFF